MKSLSPLVPAFFLAVFFSLPVHADYIDDNIKAHLNDPALDALAQDLGALNGGGSFRTGRVLGFPLGIDLGLHVPVVHVSDDDVILKENTSHIAMPIAQLGIGLPFRLNGIGRYGKGNGAELVGGGLRYGILRPSVPGLPSLDINALYNRFRDDYVKAETWSGNIVLSFDFPIIRPYLGAGYDHTTADPTDKAYEGVDASVPRNLRGEKSGYRVEGGLNLSFIPFTYLTLGGGIANGEALYHAGVGITF